MFRLRRLNQGQAPSAPRFWPGLSSQGQSRILFVLSARHLRIASILVAALSNLLKLQPQVPHNSGPGRRAIPDLPKRSPLPATQVLYGLRVRPIIAFAVFDISESQNSRWKESPSGAGWSSNRSWYLQVSLRSHSHNVHSVHILDLC